MNPQKYRVSRLLQLCFLFTLLLCPSYVLAKGDGIKVGQNGSFHPRLYADFGYTNNVFNRADVNPQALLPEDSLNLNVRPGLQLLIPSSPFGFELSGYVNYNHNLNPNAATLNSITGKGDMVIRLFKDRPVAFTLTTNFSRNSGDTLTSDDVFERVIFYHEIGGVFRTAWLNYYGSGEALFTFLPGGGAFKIDLGYQFRFWLNPDEDTDQNRHKIKLAIKWTFFPKTALLFEASGEFVNFNPLFNFSQDSQINRNGIPIKGTIGLIGNFTERLKLTIRVGGGYTLIDQSTDASLAVNRNNIPTDNYGMAIGSLNLTYYLSPTVFVRLGGYHDFDISFFSNYYHETIGYLEFAAQFGQFLFSVRGDGGFMGFARIPQTITRVANGQNQITRFNSDNINQGLISRGDWIARANMRFDFNITSWFTIGLLGGVNFRDSNLFIVTNLGQVSMSFLNFRAAVKMEFAF